MFPFIEEIKKTLDRNPVKTGQSSQGSESRFATNLHFYSCRAKQKADLKARAHHWVGYFVEEKSLGAVVRGVVSLRGEHLKMTGQRVPPILKQGLGRVSCALLDSCCVRQKDIDSC